MDDLTANISQSLESVCRQNKTCGERFKDFLSKQIWTVRDRNLVLDVAAQLFFDSNCTIDICHAFRPVLLEVLHRTKTYARTHLQYQHLSIALSKVLNICPDAIRFSLGYFQLKSPFFTSDDTSNDSGEPVRKKAKKGKRQTEFCNTKPSSCALVKAVYYCLCIAPLRQSLLAHWDWSELLDFLKNNDLETRWFCIQCIGIITGLTDAQFQKFAYSAIEPKCEVERLMIKYHSESAFNHDKAMLLTNAKQPENDNAAETQTHTIRTIVSTDLSPEIVSICGILLPKINNNNSKVVFEDLICVPSTQRNLRSLALAVASGRGVLLQGPVGCGKTALVEHLAKKTGRDDSQYLMKVQLGDQTDSKALLGTYRCTDIPGEFVWQPGALTVALTEGRWLLLEDIDYAPMDVVSILLPILENSTLSVPGHGEIKAHPGFQLFLTQRLLGSSEGWYKQQSSNCNMLSRLMTPITVEPLARTELQKVIETKYPALATVCGRLLDIYFMLSAGKHELSSDAMDRNDEDSSVGQFLIHDGRLLSTRDLMKWCSRIAVDFDVSTSSHVVYQEAIDCFCCCLRDYDKRIALATAMTVKMNVLKAKAEFYCKYYKPSIEITSNHLTIGRGTVIRKQSEHAVLKRKRMAKFSYTCQACNLLEKVAVSVQNMEPVLLVGETGTGKTSLVQYLSDQCGHKLHVINMNQQSDSTDLLGGYRPVDMRHMVAPVREMFEMAFLNHFSRKQNAKFLSHIQQCFSKKRWSDLLKLIEHPSKIAVEKYKGDAVLNNQWSEILDKIKHLQLQVKYAESALAFMFMEGTLVKALKAGDWVLLDEINLASAETLECLGGLLESTIGSIVLLERGDTKPIVRHPDFRLFACMNPATDVGKKDLPPGIRNRFTEIFVDELTDNQDLRILVSDYLQGLALTVSQVDGIVKFYFAVREAAANKLLDCTGHRPHYSLRTLCRALRQAASNMYGSIPRSLYEGFCFSFLTQLDRASHPIVEQLILHNIIGSKASIKSILKQPLPEPSSGGKYLKFEGYWISVGDKEPNTSSDYVLTPSVRANLRDVCRVVSAGRHPVLLQGETSVGKTSLINWLAQSSGNHCVRINNHEHTDLQEYVGCYAADQHGKLQFKEGVLVDAMRKGYWVILDELNLAPTDVLEALNRLLDDNRELFIPETQETVKAHSRFMLFATQNPPGLYGGRKVLSRAFRNRFVELHFDDIPSAELQTILQQRCQMPASYCKKLVAVMLDLQARRKTSGVFAGKQGFITLRDLFRWAERYRQATAGSHQKYFDWDQYLADHGYMLLAGRCRNSDETIVIQEVFKKHLKRTVNPLHLFSSESESMDQVLSTAIFKAPPAGFEHVVWTFSMRRLATMVGQALKFGEPVLLVGETGCGKTTVCQIFAADNKQTLYTINCHLHTEGSDFLGGLRPVRHHSDQDGEESHKLFEWNDGPLIVAMKEGSILLVDEISLADDSVLERLNSVLEPERTLLLAEKGDTGIEVTDGDVEQIVAHEKFRLLATMNPGGDYGKKELSPALRNRFTEIWCPQTRDQTDLLQIIEHNLKPGIHLCNQEDGTSGIGKAILEFVHWFTNNDLGKRCVVSIRDLLSWVNFINVSSHTVSNADSMDTDNVQLEPGLAYIHGACMVFIDGLATGQSTASQSVESVRKSCLRFLMNQIKSMTGVYYDFLTPGKLDVQVQDTHFSIYPFSVPKGPKPGNMNENYAVQAPTTSLNCQRLLRALQLNRPILLEGSPGVGKTSLVSALARAVGHELVRINLSDQTDVSDLFGADLPVEGGEGGQFAWRDGPFLQALKAGHWIVLDELNLASQSVLEGLNACLDHRAEVYIPELGMTFQIQRDKTRLFACQNPLIQGGGRKGLPKSFLNRFTQVFIEPLSRDDQLFIISSLYPMLPTDVTANMVDFNNKVYEETMVQCQWGQKGSPWEFNIRDILRWCDLLITYQNADTWNPGEYAGLIYRDRLRSSDDKSKVVEAFQNVFKDAAMYTHKDVFSVTTDLIQVGHSFLPRCPGGDCMSDVNLKLLHHSLAPMEALMKCMDMNWMAILLGPQSSGKTSLVHMLANLTGHKLQVLPMNSSMDTTEMLGGFEQADIGRTLENVAKSVQELSQQCMRTLITSGHQGAVVEMRVILQKMAEFNKSTQASDLKQELTEKMADIRRKVSCLHNLINCLNGTSQKFKIDLKDGLFAVTDILSGVEKHLRKGQGHVLGGGQFEWVDSVLINALKSGDWLLIDNVNFCNPSVLDRLNAMLEPGGRLCINERGVIDGQIPTIKPHPQFRLILAMDPRNGEISRAMRNRGIEIYILGQNEGGDYDEYDVKAMLHGLGLVGKLPCETLLMICREIESRGNSVDQISLLDILHVAQLTVQQLERGCHLLDALRTSCVSVLVKMQRNFTKRQEIKEVIETYLQKLDLEQFEATSNTSSLVCEGLWPVSLPSISNWTTDSTVSTVKHQMVPLMHIVSEILQNVGLQSGTREQALSYNELVRTKFSWPPNHQESDRLTSMLGVLCTMCLETVSINDLPLRKLILERLISSQIERCANRNKATTKLNQLLRNMMNSLKPESIDIFSGVLRQIENCSGMDLSQHPVDLRWNSQLLDHLTIKMDPDASHRISITTLGNKYYLLNILLEKQKLPESWQLEGQRRDKSPIQISYEFHAGLTDTAKEQESLIHIYPFFQAFDLELNGEIESMSSMSDETLYKLVDCLQWRWYFLCICQQKVKSSGGYKVLMPQLALHWNWFYNKCFNRMFSVTKISSTLETLVDCLNRLLGTDNEASMLQLKMWSGFGYPKPFQKTSFAEVTVKLLGLAQILDVFRVTVSGQMWPIVKYLTSVNGCYTRQRIDELFTMLLTNPSCNIDEICQKVLDIETELIQFGILYKPGAWNKDISQTEIQQAPALQQKLLPFYEYASLVIQKQWLNRGMDRSILNHIIDYILHFTMVSPELLIPLRQLAIVNSEDKEQLPTIIANLVGQQYSSSVTKDLLLWLLPHAIETEEPLDIESIEGPGALQTPHLAFMTMTVLTDTCRDVGIKQSYGNLQMTVPLGQCGEKLKLFQSLAKFVWSNASLVSDEIVDLRSCDENLIKIILKRLLSALSNLSPDISCHETEQAYNSIDDYVAVIEEIAKSEVLPTRMIDMLNTILQCMSKSVTLPDPMKRLYECGKLWSYVGLLQTLLLAPQGPVDPAEKQAIKLTYTNEQIGEIDMNLMTRNWANKIWTGKNLDPRDPSNHPRLLFMSDQLTALRNKAAILEQRIAIRPQPPKFIALLNDVKQYINAIGSESRVLTMITQLDTVLNCVSNDKTSTNLNTLLKEEKSWQSTVQSFIRKINRDYPFYTDLTAPFLAGISELSYGIRLMCHALQVITRQIEWKLNTEQVSVKSHVLALCKFPFIGTDIPSSLQLSEILTSHSTSMSMKQLLFSKESEDGSARITDFITRMRKQALLSLMNHIIVTGKLDDKTMIAFNNLLELFATSWLEMEERKKQKEIEDNSLYRYKEKSHGDELTEDEQDDLDLHRNFPSYESEMADLINQGKLDTSPPISGDTESEEDNSVFEVSAADMKFVSDMHYEIIVPYTQSSWLQKRTSNQNKDFRQPLMLGYQNACSVVKNRIIDIDPQTDDELLASHLIVLNTLEHSTQEQLENSSSQKPYDVYHDPNIAEVVQCRPLLYLLNSRVQELLLEWPDHPALKQIVDVINRILSFTITSPLMKLVAGIDVLLQKLQDWETNAARHVSLRSHIDSISQLLIQYRRYELKCWRSCLDMVSWRVREKASKWWFHLHQVLHGYIACTDEWIEDGVRKLVEALQNFMETSVLGEYETRLQYLYTFHCHLVSMQAVHTRQMENAQTILWNLYQFYSQFQTNVDAKIASLRSPIEKELKGYVKIARWNDINFWAMKQAAEKTHRTLQKHMKQYETVLHQPVRTLLIDQKESLSEKKIKIPVTDVNLYITSEMILSVLSTEEGSVLNRLPSLQSRMMKHCRSIFIQCNYKSMIESVDQFTGDIISTVHELQAADLTQVGDKEKQKAEAKHLNLRKRKALAELFKYLTTLGLSYRKGIIELEGRSNSDLMTCPVLDLQAALLSIIHQRCDDELLSTWEGCQKYFCRCIARRALLHTSLQTPSKELGPSEIDRCKGFTENLLTLCCSQQNVLQKAAEQFLNLRTQLSDLEEVRKTESKITRLPPQRSLQREKGRLETVIHQFDEGLNQFLVLLDAVPASSEAVNPYPSVYQSAAASLVRGDERHMNIQQCIKEILEEVQTVKQQLVKVKNSSLLTWSVYEVIKSGFEKLKSSSSKLQHIEEIFADRTCLSKTLTYLRKTLCQELSEFSKWNEELNVLQLPDNSKSSDQLMSDSQSVKEFTVNTENLATNILLVVQHLLKCHPVSEQTDADEDTVEDGHLSKLLHKQLMKDIELLNLLQITSTMEELVQGIISLSDTGELNHSNYCTGLLLNLIPLVKQYTLLVQYCITQCTATYRTSCKLLSVLLGIFSEIIQKGFCLPAEMSDELAGDGATKFEDMENAGMGEGQGQKDVSDQIETEDQLEELKKAGEEDEKADPDEKPDVPDEDNAIEMSDDFEGKLHNLDPSKEDENENSEDDDEDVENKIDKQMGDVDDENADKLDDQVWGSDDEEPEEQEQKEDKKEEVGPGSGQQEESQVVAKEDSDKSETENQPENQPADEEQQEEKINEQEPMDEEYDENQTDPYHGKDKEVPEPEALDLPEDLQLDDEENEQDEENKEQGENPMDIDNLDQPENQGEDIDAEMNEDENAQDKNEEKDGDELEEDNKEEGKEEEQDGKKSAEEDESLDIEEKPENDDESRETGVQPQIDEKVDEEDQGDEGKNGAEENNDEDNTVTEAYGKKDHDVQAAEQSESAQDSAGKTDETEENEGNGTAEADDMLGHEGSTSQQAARGQENKQRNKPQKRKPGQSDADRTMGSTDEKIKRLQTIDTKLDDQSDQVSDDKQESDLYEHINKAVSQYDAQTLDAATAEQLDQQPIPAMEDEDAEEVGPDDENMQPQDDEKCTDETVEKKLSAMKLKEKKSAENEHGEESVADEGNQASTIEGENMITMSVAPGNTSFHTALDKMTPLMGHDVEKLRNELESSFTMWQRPSGYSPEQAREAEELWYKYDAVTSSLSQELCEQLRLVLEPSRCTKLKGDYRTGKRLNMRKVIPYIASQFRKDKIWLRRTKPSKRQYQILLAVDDSSSMADNHSKQLAFESLATIANALTLLEAGELAICSFGESTQLLHPFHEQFSNQSGASLLQQFTFEQHKTKIAEFMKDVTGIMLNAREHQQGPATQEISQLVLIVSDGRGLFLEGMDVVLRAVQQAREANLFLVFVILDNPNNKNSIMDIKVPIFKGAGQMPEIRSYMEQFPFPFYIILRDINALPHTLADALRQWFELISAADR